MRPILCYILLLLVVGCKTPAHFSAFEAPSNDRAWEPSLAVLSRADVDQDHVKLYNVRRCHYVTEDVYTTEYRDRELTLDDVQTVDFIVVPFKDFPSLAHTMLSFGMADGSQIGVSVEARLEKHETYSVAKGALKQFELIYVIADEQDLITLRTQHRDTDVYVYRAQATTAQVQALFLDVLQRVNQLGQQPEFYNTLANNCTTNLAMHINALKPDTIPYGMQLLLPGHSDKLGYRLALLDTSVPFETLRARALVTAKANAANGSADFSRRIRQ